MKKVMLLAVLFLIGTAAQTKANHQNAEVYKPGKYNRYYNSHTVRFIENGVLYKVRTDGTFTFRDLGQTHFYGRRGSRNYNHCDILTDRFGRIRAVGNTYITYKRNGKVRTIGQVPLYYKRGLLVQVGNMRVSYNRRGRIRNTHGYVNKRNKKFWHDDWYTYTERNNKRRYKDWDDDDWDDDFDDDDYRRRNRD